MQENYAPPCVGRDNLVAGERATLARALARRFGRLALRAPGVRQIVIRWVLLLVTQELRNADSHDIGAGPTPALVVARGGLSPMRPILARPSA
jgi:hypothetical protein